MNALTEKSLSAFNYIKENQANDITLDSIAEAMGVPAKSINGTLVALQRKELIERVPAGTALVDGKAKVIKYIKLTEKGAAYDHDAAVALDLEEAAAAAAEKAAKKAAKDAE